MLNLKRLMILVIMSACLLITVSGAFVADSNQISSNVTADGQNHEINIDNFNVEEVENNNELDKVLDKLKGSKIYRTDQDGSIMFKIKNNKLKIETCSP